MVNHLCRRKKTQVILRSRENREDNAVRQPEALQESGSPDCATQGTNGTSTSPDGREGHLKGASHENGAVQLFSPRDRKVPFQHPPKVLQGCFCYMVECSHCRSRRYRTVYSAAESHWPQMAESTPPVMDSYSLLYNLYNAHNVVHNFCLLLTEGSFCYYLTVFSDCEAVALE